ncbi:MAG TPA: T9SS type A sorting domain-containing protein, partial [bacterium]|nr:T9SS type A sorting domain-containing protein [bacterium]
GATTMFRVPGDPVAGTGWIDENTGDRRILLVSGPTEIALGDTVETVVAVAAAMGSDRLSSVSVLKFYDRFAQNAFDVLFELPSAPPKPTVQATELNQQILLNWAVDPAAVAKVEGFNDKGYAFEGYNIYQLPSAGATASQGVKLATYDLKDGVTTIVQESFDPASGLVLSLPAQIGKDTGIKRTLTITIDRLRDMPLANGRMYYFGISAYSYNGTPGLTTVTLESPITVVGVVPQTTKPGVRLTTANNTMLEVKHAAGTSEGVVTAEVIDNTRLTGHEYKVTFRDVDGASVWDLTDVTTGTVKLSSQVNQSGDDDYLIVDGVQVKVSGPTTAGLKDNGYNYVPAANRFLTAFNDPSGAATLWPMEGWAGLFGWAENFFGTGLPATGCKNVEIRFAACDELGNPLDPNDPNASMAYRYMRRASAPAADPSFAPYIVNPGAGYAYQDMRLVCFAAYDMEANPPRRLNVGFNENNAVGGLVNGVWMPGRYDTQGGMNTTREFMFIFASDYSTTPQAMYTTNDMLNTVTNTDLMYVGVPSRRGARLPQAGDKVILEANHFNTPNDVFTFSTVSPTNQMADAVKDIEKIQVFPNPYYGFNIVEKNQFSRFVTFSHLPAKATIRIFTLAGVLIRTLEKNDPSQFTTWDLQNESGLPAASGVYLVHIDLPEVGKTKTLKLALVREQQFLTIY